MFTWICPQCGREVPPAYTECPDCAAKAAAAGVTTEASTQQAPAPPPPQYAMPVPPMPGPPASAGGAPPQYQPYGQPYPPPQYPYAQPQYPGQPQYPPQYQPYPPPQYPQQYQQPVYGQPPYAPPPPPPQPAQAAPEFKPAAPPPPPPPAPPVAVPVMPASASFMQSASPAAPAPVREPMRENPAASSLFAAPPVTERKAAMPTWLLTVLCTAGFALLVVGAYWLFGSHSKAPAAQAASPAAPAANQAAAANPWQKFIEVSGVRLQENPKNKNEVVAKFIVTNHSESDLNGLAGDVTVLANAGGDSQGTFSFKTNLGPYDSKELSVPFQTNLKVYELPDWNLIHTSVQLTNPAATGSGGQ